VSEALINPAKVKLHAIRAILIVVLALRLGALLNTVPRHRRGLPSSGARRTPARAGVLHCGKAPVFQRETGQNRQQGRWIDCNNVVCKKIHPDIFVGFLPAAADRRAALNGSRRRSPAAIDTHVSGRERADICGAFRAARGSSFVSRNVDDDVEALGLLLCETDRSPISSLASQRL
jgi:hypothetical protein